MASATLGALLCVVVLLPLLGACARDPIGPRAPGDSAIADTPPARPGADRFEQAALPPIAGELVARMHLVDVGQGAATLFELPCAAILVDTGGEAGGGFSAREALHAYLDAFFDRRADLARTLALLVITHPHVDHTRNIKSLIDDYAVENVVTDGRTSGSGGSQQKWLQSWASDNVHFEAVQSERVPAGGLTSRVIDPVHCKEIDPEVHALWGSVAERPIGWTKDAFEDENNHSVVVRIDAGPASFLVGGDLETAGMNAVLAKHRGTRALDVDVLEINHHGSDNGTSRPWLDAASPVVALVAVGSPEREAMWTAWAYGHPRRSVLDLLLAGSLQSRPPVTLQVAARAKTFETVTLSRAFYGTGWDGDVVVTARSDGSYRVQTRR